MQWCQVLFVSGSSAGLTIIIISNYYFRGHGSSVSRVSGLINMPSVHSQSDRIGEKWEIYITVERETPFIIFFLNLYHKFFNTVYGSGVS